MPNLPWAMLRPSLCVVAATLPLLVESAAPDAASRADGLVSHDQPTRTAKERLGVKASDEQRAWSRAAPAPAI